MPVLPLLVAQEGLVPQPLDRHLEPLQEQRVRSSMPILVNPAPPIHCGTWQSSTRV